MFPQGPLPCAHLDKPQGHHSGGDISAHLPGPSSTSAFDRATDGRATQQEWPLLSEFGLGGAAEAGAQRWPLFHVRTTPVAQHSSGALQHLGTGLLLLTATPLATGPSPAGQRKLAGRKRSKRLIYPGLIKSYFEDPGCGQKD